MSDDPDIPYDPTLLRMAGMKIPDGSGTFSRRMKTDAAKRRQRARQMEDRGDVVGAAREDHDAAYLERQADRFRDPLQAIGGPLAAGNGGEVVRAEPSPDQFQKMIEQPPDMLAAEATEKRMILTHGISDAALTLAVEASESIGARDALERNLMHQMAAGHALGMTLLAKASGYSLAIGSRAIEEGAQQMYSIEAARMAKAGARVLEAAQSAMLTWDRLRHGGRQVVTVQHVTVQDGGQAVVAGTLKRGEGGR